MPRAQSKKKKTKNKQNKTKKKKQKTNKTKQKKKNLNIRYDTIKLEENIGKTFSDINSPNISLGHSPKAIEIKTKINKWFLIKFTGFRTAKETINKMKRQHTQWEKTVANDATDWGLISKIYKQLI